MDSTKIQNAIALLQAAAAHKTIAAPAADPALKAAEDKKEAAGKAYKEAATKSSAAHKACKALHEHLSGMAEEGHEGAKALAEDGEKVHKAMKALHEGVHKAAGSKPEDDEDEKEGSEKILRALDAATKAIAGMSAKITMLETASLQPRAAGAGAAISTAVKGAGIQVDAVAGAKLASESKKLSEMTEDERNEARKAALSRTMRMPVPIRVFEGTSQHTLRAADKAIALADAVEAGAGAGAAV